MKSRIVGISRLLSLGLIVALSGQAQARRGISIVASIGPASSDTATLRRLVRAGASMFRLNMAHQDQRSTPEAMAAIRKAAGRRMPILCDLPGGKLRTGPMAANAEKVTLQAGTRFVLRHGDRWPEASRQSSSGSAWIDYDNPPGVTVGQYARPGGRIWLHQGKIVLDVERVSDGEIHTRVVAGGQLSSRASLALMGQDPAFPELTDDDRQKLAIAVRNGATHVGASMIQRPGQIDAIRSELSRLGAPHVKVVAKIETIGALEPKSLDAIVRRADEVMIARGDLGVALEGNARALHRAERQIARTCRQHGKRVMDATGFLSALRTHGSPSMTNLQDIRHARFAVRPDSIMLKGTAINDDPVAPVKLLRRVLTGKDRTPQIARLVQRLERTGGEARAGELAAQTNVSRGQLKKTLHLARRLGVLQTRGQLVQLGQAVVAR